MSAEIQKKDLIIELSLLQDQWKKKFSEEILLFPFHGKLEIKDFLIKQFNDFDPRLFTNKFIPQTLNLNGESYLSSLSHCQSQGLFMISKTPTTENILGFGVDIEQKSRLTKQLIKRISSSKEIQRLSENLDLSFHLWTVKESSFKALPLAIQPRVISKITLETFSILSHSTDSFTTIKTSTIKDTYDSFFHSEADSSLITFEATTEPKNQTGEMSQIDISIMGLSFATKDLVISLALSKKAENLNKVQLPV